MKLSHTKFLLLVSLAAPRALAYPGMDETLREIQSRDEVYIQGRSTSLLGDLVNSITTAVGQTISSILQGTAGAIADSATYKAPGPLGSDACKKDKVCVWKYIADEMASSFSGCSALARGAIRLGFHDAAAWDTSSSYGGADGSILLNSDELNRFDNRGLPPTAAYEIGLYNKYKQYGAGAADIAQLGATVATVSCPGGPRIRSFAGRKDSAQAAPTGKLPSPFQSAQDLIALFNAKTFTAADLVALLGAHSTSKQQFVDPSRKDTSAQDSTPAAWDTRYYGETLTNDNKTNVLVFPSDRNLATYGATQGTWNSFAGSGGQGRWGPAYAFAYFRMSMLGVKNLNDLYDITKVLPLPK